MMDWFITLISKFIPLDFIAILKINLHFSSYFNDEASLYMNHLVEFHNQVMLYLLVLFVFICVILIYLFTPLLLNHLSRRSLYVLISTNYYLLPIKVFFTYIIYKAVHNITKCVLYFYDANPLVKVSLQKKVFQVYSSLFGLSIIDNYNKNLNLVDVNADVTKNIKIYDENLVLSLMTDFTDWNFDYDDIEIFLMQKQATLMLDYTNNTRGFYWVSKLSQKDTILFNLMNKIKSLNNLKYYLGTFLSFKNIHPKLLNRKINSSQYNFIYEANSFKHHGKIEWFFCSIPTVTVINIIVPSVALIYETNTEVFDPDFFIKVQGSQWYWTYEILLYFLIKI